MNAPDSNEPPARDSFPVPYLVPTSPVALGLPEPALRFLERNQHASAQYKHEAALRTEDLKRHLFRKEVTRCSDWRTNRFRKAIHVIVGMMESYISAGAVNEFSHLPHAERTLKNVRRARRVKIDGCDFRKRIMRFCTVHYSSSKPDSNSCAYWMTGHKKWKDAQETAMKTAADYMRLLHKALPGQMIAVPVLFDTDTDAITVVGPNGRVEVFEHIDDDQYNDDRAVTLFLDHLVQAFPDSWSPLAVFDSLHRNAFRFELAESLAANLMHVRVIRDSGREISYLTHQERMLFVGRHGDEASHNQVFMIDDTSSNLAMSFVVGMRFVAKNTLLDAIQSENKDWRIPIFVNVPFDGDDEDDESLSRVYVSSLIEETLMPCFVDCQKVMLDELRKQFVLHAPEWLMDQLKYEHVLMERVQFISSVSNRADRQFTLFNFEKLYNEI